MNFGKNGKPYAAPKGDFPIGRFASWATEEMYSSPNYVEGFELPETLIDP
jgi:hypothetical protein